MKKLIFFALLISTCTFGQSVTISPSTISQALEPKKDGIGLNHRNNANVAGVGTYTNSGGAYIQTHTAHDLKFATNSSSPQMVLKLTTGNVGIGTMTPTQKLHVEGNSYVTGTTNIGGLLTGNNLTIGSGGTTINKFLKVYLTNQTISGLSPNFCGTISYNVTGVSADDTVILNIESPFSNLHVAAVIADENAVKVKYCNVGTSIVNASTGNLRFTVIK